MSSKIWTTAKGEKIHIKDMSNAHLVHTIRFLERKKRDNELDAFEAAASMNGEMASYYLEGEAHSLLDKSVGDVWPIYDDMVNEAESRGLEIYDKATGEAKR